MSSNRPLISVIMTVYDRPCFLAEAIDSILQQSFSDLELIIVNDGNVSLQAAEINERYARQDARIRLIVQDNNTGPSGARNTGIHAACGDYVVLMDDDDISEPQRLEKQFSFLEEHPDIAAACCGAKIVDEQNNVLKDMSLSECIIQPPLPALENFHDRQNKLLINATSVIRRKALIAVGGYRQCLRTSEDRDLTLRLEEKYSLAAMTESLYRYRQHDKGNLCRDAIITWFDFCAVCVSAMDRRANKKDPMDASGDVRMIALRSKELPSELLAVCAWAAGRNLKKVLRTEQYDIVRQEIKECKKYFPKSIFFMIRTRLLLWALFHGKFGYFYSHV